MLECPFTVNTKMHLDPEIFKKHCMILPISYAKAIYNDFIKLLFSLFILSCLKYRDVIYSQVKCRLIQFW